MDNSNISLFDALIFLSLVIQAEADDDRHAAEEILKRIDKNIERLCERLC